MCTGQKIKKGKFSRKPDANKQRFGRNVWKVPALYIQSDQLNYRTIQEEGGGH